jgi:hypothetical protein
MIAVAAISNMHCRNFETVIGFVDIYLKLNKLTNNNNNNNNNNNKILLLFTGY